MADLKPFAGMAQEETLQGVWIELARIFEAFGIFKQDSAGRLSVVLDAASVLSTVSTITTVSTVSTVSSVTSVIGLGGTGGGTGAINGIPVAHAMMYGSESDYRQLIVQV